MLYSFLKLGFGLLCSSLGWATDNTELNAVLQRIETETQRRATVGSTTRSQEILKAPSIVKSYTQEDLAHFDSLYDFLSHVPGVLITEDRFAQRFVQVRGMNQQVYNNRVLVLINGHRAAFELAPETSLDIVPIRAIRRLEVIRGPGAVLHGSSAYSAVIHIITHDGAGYENNTLETGLGTDGRRHTDITLHEKIGDQESLFVAARYFRQDGANRPGWEAAMVDGAGLNIPTQLNYAQFLDYELQEQSKSLLASFKGKNLSVTAGAFSDIRTLDYTRRFINPANLGQYGLEIPFNSDRINEIRFFGGEWEEKLNARTDLSLRAKYAEASQETRDNGLPFLKFLGHSHDTELEMRLTHRSSERVKWVAGFHRQDIAFGQRLHLGPLGFDMVAPTRLHISGAYLQGQFQLHRRLDLLLAYRNNDNSTYEGKNGTPKAALTWLLDEDESLKLIYGEAFRYPSGYERYGTIPGGGLNPNLGLNEETLKSWELSWMKLWNQGKQSLEITLFDIQMDDFITRISTSRDHRNMGSFNSKGIEADWEKRFNPKERVWANLSLMEFENRQAPGLQVGQYHHSTLETKASFGLDHQINSHLDFSSRTLWIGPQEMPRLIPGMISPAEQGSVFVSDWIFTYNHSKTHKLEIRLENIFDKRYAYPDYDVHYSRQVTYPEGRQISAVYKIQF